MKAGDVMTTGAATVRPEAPLVDAAQLMVQHQISGLPVIDSHDRLVGLVTENDFLRAGASGKPRLLEMLATAGTGESDDLHVRRVEELMTREPITISAETPLEDVINLMHRHNVRRLPVVADGKVVGIVSRGNLLRALLRRSMAPVRRP
jgi:CBS domain-containing protein